MLKFLGNFLLHKCCASGYNNYNLIEVVVVVVLFSLAGRRFIIRFSARRSHRQTRPCLPFSICTQCIKFFMIILQYVCMVQLDGCSEWQGYGGGYGNKKRDSIDTLCCVGRRRLCGASFHEWHTLRRVVVCCCYRATCS